MLPLDAPGPAAEALRTGAPAFIGDGATALARHPALADVWTAMGVAATATVPLAIAHDDSPAVVVGAMTCGFAAPRAFDDEDRAFFVALGQQAAQALERARLYDAERAARAEAEPANRAQSEFLVTMSHELRTPLNAIGGYAQLLELGVRGPLMEPQRKDLARIRRANQHLTGIVTDILNFARLEAGQIEFRLTEVPLAPVIAVVESLVRPQLASKGLAFDHAACGPDSPEQPHVVRADPEKLRQVLLNLLGNAVKFTGAGGRVAFACETDAPAGVVRVHVSDTRCGIPPERLASVFEPWLSRPPRSRPCRPGPVAPQRQRVRARLRFVHQPSRMYATICDAID